MPHPPEQEQREAWVAHVVGVAQVACLDVAPEEHISMQALKQGWLHGAHPCRGGHSDRAIFLNISSLCSFLHLALQF